MSSRWEEAQAGITPVHRGRWVNDLSAYIRYALPHGWDVQQLTRYHSMESWEDMVSCVLVEHEMGWQTVLRTPLSDGWNHALLTQAQHYVDECMASTIPTPTPSHG